MTVPSGQMSAGFAVTTSLMAVNTMATITAGVGTCGASASVMVIGASEVLTAEA